MVGVMRHPNPLSFREIREIRGSYLGVRVQLTTAEKTEVVTNCDHLARLKFQHPKTGFPPHIPENKYLGLFPE